MMHRNTMYHPGVAVLTARHERQAVLQQELDAAGIAQWVVLIQDRQRGRMLPPFGGPLLLDTVGFARAELAALLAELHVRRPPVPTVILVAPDDLATQRLSLLCSAVYAMAADTLPLANLRLWFRYVGRVGPDRLAEVQPACLGFIPPPLPTRDPDLLSILAELPHAQTMEQAAQACAMSERTLKRKLTITREALGIPATGLTRYRPRDLATLLWTAFASGALESPTPAPADAAWIIPGSADPRCVDLTTPLPMRSRSLA